jgi:hypothetical protein
LLLEKQWLGIGYRWVGVAVVSLWIPARIHEFYRNNGLAVRPQRERGLEGCDAKWRANRSYF